MPNPKDPPSSPLIFQIELAVFFLLLLGIGYLSWQLASDATKATLRSRSKMALSEFSRQLTPVMSEPDVTPLPPASTPSSLPSPSPTPPLTLPTGSQTYNFSHGKNVVGPKVKSLTVDPLDPAPNGSQTLTLTATHNSPVTNVTIEVITDNNAITRELTRVGGTNLDGTWQGSWLIGDSYSRRYGFRLLLDSSLNNYDNTMWIR